MSITLTSGSTVIQLPGDMQWVDEFTWLPTAAQVEVACNGALIVEEAAQLAGRPITLEGRFEGKVGFALPDRATVLGLRAVAAVPRPEPMTLVLEDGRGFYVRFRHFEGLAVEARPIKHIVPAQADDFYSLTLRLMQV